MADTDTRAAPAEQPRDESRSEARRDLNKTVAQRQKLLLAGIGGVALIAGSMFIFGGDDAEDGEGAGSTTIETGALVNRNLSQREFVATYGNRLDAQGRAIKDLQESQLPKASIEQELETLRGENARMLSDGQAAIDAISAENAALRSELETQRAYPPVAPATPLDPRALGAAPGAAPAALDPSAGPMAEPKASLLSFSGEKPGTAGKKVDANAPPLLLEASRDYLPPNSYAPATVIVGVDASTGVTSQSDPLPVVLRITGPARSVLRGNRLLTTDLTGCLVNGAARGDLSAEKVYVKLVRMTCAQPGGRFAVSEVKGFIAFAGKSGVRGRVVSREGSLVSQALLAGIVGGFGRGFSANANGIFAGQVGSDGKREALSPTDILAGGFGQGAGEAADTVSKYLIERAEQYQPVVEMPTGIEVEIVFLDGVHVRSTDQ
ncbi:TraB/VirB10 family protein [Citromicrobium bathyomarinum]|jgi:conjugal transfer pilus assembly protein TraB|uniref:Pilus assembly protein n=1 Tax=Erythrobacter litoralis (strain HTCC2594) TaxID=314225 RepID=Q2NDG8_ERYLH|nr:TraB/VirB10 family protein [Erythrobacter litoralis]ABC62273.1 pilus assembly protein [Erythrobacter litoralis HTCC2594]MAY78132.1 conjugal transfer protein TraB [Citromicrobium sp.]|tara:strand:+ start:22979 stop:24286 length:1308 start_codon:yes stop_codon:yes gene_type:complete